MRAVVQRVSRASVKVDGEVVGSIGRGLLVYLGCLAGDDEATARRMAQAIANLRVFPDEEGRMNKDLSCVGGSVLLVSQFTLAWDADKGRRPSFSKALEPARAEALVQLAELDLRARGLTVETGTFRAHMLVESVNDGPVTFHLERLPTGR